MDTNNHSWKVLWKTSFAVTLIKDKLRTQFLILKLKQETTQQKQQQKHKVKFFLEEHVRNREAYHFLFVCFLDEKTQHHKGINFT